ncbi:DAK2 domain-containing protein [Anoxynatronum buryatiense]|uniref:DhaL domain-containing protein n=1 Tax=Anoxynatronum buryatiense TaxID=489973 RepID=A0AA45WTU6_9CLOT|nr:DegV family protein [Anoxynatronum buryatiense]SMP43973.1 hypothetical protein SAMN06296020_102116 [Anoxynatronum buryatiense]
MKIRYINGTRIYYAFLAGAREVTQQRRHLNEINVFPVADGDTGSNMASTLNHILQTVKPTTSIYETLQSIADASLAGARGNSGIILAQFLSGVAAEVHQHQVMTAERFGQTLVNSVPYAYGSMAQPVEGTMLTVIRAWAEAFHEAGKASNDFVEILNSSLEKARDALMKTPEKLEVLKKAKVVDSGGQGFVHFLEGIGKMIQSGNYKQFLSRPAEMTENVISYEVLSPEKTTYRYCTEGMLSGEHIPLEEIKEMLKQLGDSVIVAGNQFRCRFHFHTDYPENVFVKLMKYGQLTEQKVDDMVRQQDALFHRKAGVALVTDSIADLPRSFQDNYQVFQIPLQVMVEGSPFLDQVTLTTSTLFQVLEDVTEYPTSSQPTVKKVQETLEFLLQQYDDVLMLAVSAQNSGTWQTFRQAAADMQRPGKRIHVIDTRKNSGAEGLLVMMAAEAIAAGKSLEEVSQLVESLIPKTHIYVSVATFEYMVRGGRVSPMKGRLARWMNLKPIVSLDEAGKGVAFGKAFSRAANTRKIMEIVKGHHAESLVERYCVVHAEAPEKAEEYAEKLTQILGMPPAYITEISPIVALNAGQGAVAVALVQK